MSWATDDGGKHGSWSIVSGEAGFAHSWSIVYDKGSNFVVTHDYLFMILFLN